MCFLLVRDVTKNHIFMTSPIWKSIMVPCAEVDLSGLGRRNDLGARRAGAGFH